MAQTLIVPAEVISPLSVVRLQAEHLRPALGVGTGQPRLSWIVNTESRDWRQSAYAVEAYDAEGKLWGQTGRIESDQSVLVAWPCARLASRRRLSIRVRVWGRQDDVSDWSEPLSLETGLLSPTDWQARFVSPTWDEEDQQSNPAPYMRREFELRPGVKSARLYITALGLYEAQLNGNMVDDQVLAPGWTVYDQRLRYQTFDVTALLNPGRNAIGAILGDGWFRGRVGVGGGRRNIYGKHLALLAQLEIQYADGSRDCIVTDEAWRAATGPLRLNSLYDGETYDARLEQPGWSQPGFADSTWSNVGTLDWDLKTLEAPVGPPVRRIEKIAPVSISQSPSGKTLVDFGQNLVGRLSISVQGPAGQTVTLRHAEVLQNGELCTGPLRLAQATDRYTLRGGERETWEPRFTSHGFRFAEVTGWPGDLNPQDISAVVLHSDLERTGWFDCSDPLLNRFHENVVWSMRGNFVDLPTDCPQRDERLGWTGDIQVFSPAAAFLYDVSGFLQSWLRDVAAEQRKAGGVVPPVVPGVLGETFGTAAWGDVATIVPWVLYQRYGDGGLLVDQFESMCAWVDHVASVSGDRRLWEAEFQFGDWLDPTAPPDKPAQSRTDKALVASAYFVRSAELVGRAAEVLGRRAEQHRYQTLAAEARAAFAREYVTPAGRLMSDAETAYALALVFDLLPSAEQRQRAGDRLDTLVREGGYTVRTGFVGTPLICEALCCAGHEATAYRLLMQRDYPSWLYQVTMGATTIWERWDCVLPDGSINMDMSSFNHYAFGAVADWMHRTLGGLAPLEPGYRRMELRPRPGGGLTHCQVKHLTPYGLAISAWKIEAGKFELEAIVPPNTTALVTLPGSDTAPIEVGSGAWHWSTAYPAPAAHAPYTVDDLTGELLADRVARETVLTALERAGVPSFFRDILFNERSLSVRQALRLTPNYAHTLTMVREALAHLSRRSVPEDADPERGTSATAD
jgi:alpha-L-rhamnosidase